MRNVDPTLPRYGTDLIATTSRDAQRPTRRYRVTVLTSLALFSEEPRREEGLY